jgi:hypothetical protein
MDSDRAH